MRIVFMGTPQFAVPCLDVLIKNHDVVGVYTQPDRPKGRGKKLAMSAIKERALEDDIPVYQPEKIRISDALEVLEELNPDVIVVVAYGQILPQSILDLPKYGCINVHASLLPKLRGAAPINWSIVNGHEVTGVTTMYMAKGIDTGDMIQKSKTPIPQTMTAGELHDVLSDLGKDLILKTLAAFETGDFTRTPQDHDASTHAPMMDKSVAVIRFDKTAQEVHNQIRGFNPWPVATTTVDGDKMKCFKSFVTDEQSTGTPGEIVKVTKEGIFVNCSDVQLCITEIQMPNKKRVNVEQYILGNTIETGLVLGAC